MKLEHLGNKAISCFIDLHFTPRFTLNIHNKPSTFWSQGQILCAPQGSYVVFPTRRQLNLPTEISYICTIYTRAEKVLLLYDKKNNIQQRANNLEF